MSRETSFNDLVPPLPASHAPRSPEHTGWERDIKLKQKQRSTLIKKLTAAAAFGVNMSIISGGAVMMADGDRIIARSMAADTSHEGFPDNEQMISEMAEDSVDLGIDSLAHHVNRGIRGPEKEMAMVSPEGFESMELSKEFLNQYLGAYPSAWTKQSTVKTFALRPEDLPMPYPGFEEQHEFAHCACKGIGAGDVVFTSTELVSADEKARKSAREYLLREVITHELAHANSWENSEQFTEQEGLELRYMVFRAVKSDNRPKFGYPEHIKPDPIRHHPERRQTTTRMTEYFAELMMHVFTSRFDASKEPTWKSWDAKFAESLEQTYRASPEEAKKNAHLVEWYFSHIDPNFKPWEAASRLGELRTTDVREQHIRVLMPAIGATHDPALEHAIGEHLHAEYTRKAFAVDESKPAVKGKKPIAQKPTTPLYGKLTPAKALVLNEWKTSVQRFSSLSWQTDVTFGGYDSKSVAAEYSEFAKRWNALGEVDRAQLRPQLLAALDEAYAGLEPKTLWTNSR